MAKGMIRCPYRDNTPRAIYGVQIDETNSDPLTRVTYIDDCVGMEKGSDNWDYKEIFRDIRPCVLKNGVVQYYLNPQNFAQKADGSPADITTGNDGDVMIEIPKFAYMLSRTGTTVTVKISRLPNIKTIDSRFSFQAFSRATEGDRDCFYIGAYLGYETGGKIRSLSGKTPTGNQVIGTCRTKCQANGTGYNQLNFYQLTALQCLYLMKYGSTDSQAALGKGYTSSSNPGPANTGGTNNRGMYFGSDDMTQVKFAGIEDCWGNMGWFIDGAYCSASVNILTSYKNYNDDGTGYQDNGQGTIQSITIGQVMGSTNTGFIIRLSGGNYTHYTDLGELRVSCVPSFGGHWTTGHTAGMFMLRFAFTKTTAYSWIGTRLSYC